MDYSDVRYDSDGDSADVLSPSDGYFPSSNSSNVVPHVPNVMVPDPTVRQSETAAESKAREANENHVQVDEGVEDDAEESVINSRSPQSGQSTFYPRYYQQQRDNGFAGTRDSAYYNRYRYTPSSSSSAAAEGIGPAPRQHSLQFQPWSRRTLPSTNTTTTIPNRGGRTPSVYSDAPPAYTPSPTSPLSPTSPRYQNRNYSTLLLSRMGIENERLLGRDPESMRPIGDDDHDGDHTPRWSRRIRRRLPPWKSWRMVLLAAVLMVVIIGFLTSSFRIFKGGEQNKNTIKPQLPPEEVEQPEQPPPSTTEPGLGSPVLSPLQPSFCHNASYRFSDQIMAVKFGPGQNFSFLQTQHSHGGGMHVKVGGQVNIRQLDEGSEPRVVVEIATNDRGLLLDVLLDEVDQAVQVSVPKKYDATATGEEPCVEMRATLWVPKGGELELLSVAVTQLDVLLLNNLSMKVGDFSKMSSVTGDIVSGIDKPRTYAGFVATNESPDYTFVPAKQDFVFDSRVIEVTVTSGKIDGNWPLYDMLGLHTTAGNIKVSITPYPELATRPRPAVLSMSSISGSIHATEPLHVTGQQIPPREYLVDVHSTSGDIHGAFAFSTGCTLKSTASDIAVDLLPVMDERRVSPSQPAQLETTSTSGTTAVRVLEPMWFGGSGAGSEKPFDCLQALHKSASANVGLRYPQSYAGSFYAETKSGDLKVRGKDVKILKSVGGWPGSKTMAYKGKNEGASSIVVKTLMGGTDALLGEE